MANQWERFKKYYLHMPQIGIDLDISRMNFRDGFLEEMEAVMQGAFDRMERLEAGEIANPDEGRMVGHYWLRNPDIAPTEEIRNEIRQTTAAVKKFAAAVASGEVTPPGGGKFRNFLLIGIGGSALGPQFVADVFAGSDTILKPYFFDNTDPDGFDKVLEEIGDLSTTLCLVISKSGGTKETRNGMLEAREAFARQGLDFGKHAVAVTGSGSELESLAKEGKWVAIFPMWDWVGGRTSETSAVGLLPAALQGVDVDAFLEGARLADDATRQRIVTANPAALLALMWFHATDGVGRKDMVILPYKDRLLLFSRYLQQLIMESLGKEKDLDGNVVRQGIAVYGNKGSTDQHAYVQQLREGIDNFFATFVEVLEDREGAPFEVEPDVTSGDYLFGFMMGTREALAEKGRESLTLTLSRLDAGTVGALIALYERAVGLYAFLININAYHQPGVEAGKKAAAGVLALHREILTFLRSGKEGTPEEIAAELGRQEEVETIFKILLHLESNRRGVASSNETNPVYARFYWSEA